MFPFHHAFRVSNLSEAESFYGGLLGCRVGRRAERWIDFDFYGHQITAHLVEPSEVAGRSHNPVDGDQVPVPHFGLILPLPRWEQLVKQLQERGATFLLGPRTRFRGEPGEQGTFFLRDPSGNTLEFKGFADPESIFAT